MTRVEIEYSLHNQVLRAAFSLETLTHYVPRKIFLIFPRTAVRFRGDDRNMESGDDGKGGRDDSREVEMPCVPQSHYFHRTAVPLRKEERLEFCSLKK